MFDFPASPTNGQEYLPAGGPDYVWNSSIGAWLIKTTSPGSGTSLIAVYDTLAHATAATINPAVPIIRLLGRNTVGDGANGAEYTRIAPSTAAAWRFQSADGQWWSLINRVVSPEMFGAFSGVDCTAALQAMAAWINTISPSGTVVNFTTGADYKIWPAGSTPTRIFELADCSGLVINWNGAKLSTDNMFSPQGNAFVFFSYNLNRIILNNPKYEQTAFLSLSPSQGGAFFLLADQSPTALSRGIIINNLQMKGGRIGLYVSPAARWPKTTENIRLHNASFNSVYYAMNFVNGGDDFRGDATCTNCGRPYFPYGVSNHEVMLISDGGGPFNDVLLKVYAIPTLFPERNTLSNIRLTYRNQGRINNSVSQSLVALSFQQEVPHVTVSAVANNGSGKVRLTVNSTADMASNQIWYVDDLGGFTGANKQRHVITVINATTVDLPNVNFAAGYTSGGFLSVPASMKNIDITMDVDDTNGNQQPPAVVTYKHLNDGSNDTTSSGYSLENISISGSLKHYDYGTNALDLFTNGVGEAAGVWTNDTIINFVLRDMFISGANTSARLNATSTVPKSFMLENVFFSALSGNFTITDPANLVKISNSAGSGITHRIDDTIIGSFVPRDGYFTNIYGVGWGINSGGYAAFTSGIGINGTSFGVVSVNVPAAITSYNFNLPAGPSAAVGWPLLAGQATAFGSAPMTFGPLATTAIVGSLTNDAAPGGFIGEHILSQRAVGSALAAASGTAIDVCSVSLTAGDWDLEGVMHTTQAGTTNFTGLYACISVTAGGTFDWTEDKFNSNVVGPFVPGGGHYLSVKTPIVRISLAATTTVYLKGYANFTVSTLSLWGALRARRVR